MVSICSPGFVSITAIGTVYASEEESEESENDAV
jgi:hypothetical protein